MTKHEQATAGKAWPAFLASVAVHVLFFAFFLLAASTGTPLLTRSSQTASVQPAATIQAKAIDEQQLAAEIARLNKKDEEKLARQQALRKQAEKLKQQRLAEEKHLQQLHQEAQLANKKAKQQRLAEEKRLAALKEEQAVVAKRRAQEEAALLKKRQEEQQKLAAIKKERQLEEKKRQQEEAARKRLAAEKSKQAEQEKQRAAELKKQQRLHEQQLSQIVDKFGSMLQAKVTQNWIKQGTTDDAYCVLRVRLAPGGIVLDVEIQQSSGDNALDRSAVAAIYKSSPLPVPQDPEAFERMRDLRLTLRPKDILSAG